MSEQSSKYHLVAVFDFDGTLTRSDSFLRFIRFALPLNKLAVGVTRSLPTLAKMRMGKISSSTAKERIFAFFFKGLSKEEIKRRGNSFEPALNPEVVKKMEDLRQKGARIIVDSASLDLWIEPWCEKRGITPCCTQTQTDDRGLLTGRFSTPNCKGPEKVKRLKQLLPPAPGIKVIAFGNSSDDMDLLNFADEAYLIAGQQIDLIPF